MAVFYWDSKAEMFMWHALYGTSNLKCAVIFLMLMNVILRSAYLIRS
jgi:hypothetical protein